MNPHCQNYSAITAFRLSKKKLQLFRLTNIKGKFDKNNKKNG
jgi:hypothetical protein